ncbi:MAG: SirB2 family protein [Arenimonas sp.]
MSLLEFYPQIKLVHVAAVISSGSVFSARGLMVLAGKSHWAMQPLLRYTSYAIDTVLLTAALMLLSILPAPVFANGWLAVKLVLVVAYIILGTLALKRGRTPGLRVICYVLAALVFVLIISIARSHQPYGFLLRWLA